MTPEDRYHFEPMLLSVESAIERGESVGQYHHSEVLRLLRAALPQPATEPHPDKPHEFTTVCGLCGEDGHLFVAVITDFEVVKVEPR